ncbi:uncharacterized protein [Spinacia oleracea]|uniref:Retrotransposon Copia-like N-terminal domain-containing protein n=1 Tax=Spinacia oleracea TaxID=3562 RepID=A0ABM3R236_SPIOL|nr:uncharacterized protein LOC110778163 [Spinacia oleracea]
MDTENRDQRRSTLPPNQDPASIYYIHPSDANSVQLISFKFNGEGYTSWKRSMLLALSAKNKIGFVDGSIEKPDPGTIECKAWERCNDLVCSLILCNLDEVISKSVMFLKSARAVWTDLEERFGFASMAQVYSLEQKLSEITQGNKSVSEFFTEIKSIWDAIEEAHPMPYCTCNNCTCNVTKKFFQRQQEKMVMQFMMKLADQYATIRGNVLMVPELPKVSEVYRLFAQEERHQEVSHTSNVSESVAFAAEKRRFGGDNWNNRNKSQATGYHRAGAHNRQGKAGANYFCTNCQIPGHSIERCFKIIGYPPGFQPREQKTAAMSYDNHSDAEQSVLPKPDVAPAITADQYQQLLNLLNKQQQNIGAGPTTQTNNLAMMAGNLSLLSQNNSRWLLDSGASDHFCHDLTQFSDYKSIEHQGKCITIPDGTKVAVKHVGSVSLSDNIVLKNVLHVPKREFDSSW